MIPLIKPSPSRHWDSSDVESPASSHPSLPTKQEQPALEIPTCRRWLVVIGAFLALFCTFGQLSSFGTFLSWYSHNQLSSYSPSTISWIGSLQLWVFFFSVSTSGSYDTTIRSKMPYQGAIVGRCFDRYGPRPLLVTGAVIYVSSVMMTSLCKSYYQYLLAQGALFGLGVGLMCVFLIQFYTQPTYHDVLKVLSIDILGCDPLRGIPCHRSRDCSSRIQHWRYHLSYHASSSLRSGRLPDRGQDIWFPLPSLLWDFCPHHHLCPPTVFRWLQTEGLHQLP